MSNNRDEMIEGLIKIILSKDVELAMKDKELQKEKDALNWYQKDYANQMEELAKELAEKDLQIKKLKYMVLEQEAKNQDQLHQICEKIREKAYFDHYTDCDGKTQVVYCIETEKLDQIEKGE